MASGRDETDRRGHTARRAGRNAKEITIPKIEVTGLGDCDRNVGYKTGSTVNEFEIKTFNHGRGIKLPADVMDVGAAVSQAPSNTLIHSRLAYPPDNPALASTSCGNTGLWSRQSLSRP